MTKSTDDVVARFKSDIEEEGGTRKNGMDEVHHVRKKDLDIEAKLKVIAKNDKIIKSLEDPEKFLEDMGNTGEDQSFEESVYEHGW